MGSASYRAFGTGYGLVMYREDAADRLRSADAVILDLDGTLVDVRNSYLKAAVESARILAALRGLGLKRASELWRLIPPLKEAGFLSNDWDTATSLYVVLLREAREGAEPLGLARELASGGPEGLRSIVRSLDDEFLRGCPGSPPTCAVSSLFDSLYYGGPIYREIYGEDPPLPLSRGLWEYESPVVEPEDLRVIGSLVPRGAAILTGRPRRAMREHIKRIIAGSVGEGRVFVTGEMGTSKPDPRPLLELARSLGSSSPVYVGDSPEDLLMAEASRDAGLDVAFVGVYGASPDPSWSIEWFSSRGAHALVPSPRPLQLLLRP